MLYSTSGGSEITEFVNQLLTTEKKAKEIISHAEKEKEKKISHAKEKALADITAQKKGLKEAQDAHVAEEMNHINEEKTKITQQYTGQIQQIQTKAEKKMDKAVELVLDNVLQR